MVLLRSKTGAIGRCSEGFLAFNDLDAGIYREVFVLLDNSCGPSHGNRNAGGGVADAEVKLLGVLRSKSGPGGNELGLALSPGLQGDDGSYRVAIAGTAVEPQRDAIANSFQVVAEKTQLRASAIFEGQFQAAIVVKVA